MSSVGVIGPRDLVEPVADVCAAISSLRPVALPYQHESETEALLASAPTPDGWLFTGVVPYEIAGSAGLLSRPATYVDYTGATLLRALVELLRDGRDVTRMSIDTLSEAAVAETLAEARLPTGDVHVLAHRPGVGSAQLVEFHRRCHRERRTEVAITCVRSAYDVLRAPAAGTDTAEPGAGPDSLGAGPVPYWLAPSVHSVRTAVHRLVLLLESRHSGDAQVALGLVRPPPSTDAGWDGLLRREVEGLGGSLTRYDDRHLMVVTTRGPLETATGSFRELAMLDRLAERCGPVLVGFGVGGSAAEAESLARRALTRAAASGRTAAAIALRNDIDILLASRPEPGAAPPTASLGQMARRAGLSEPTLLRLRELARHAGEAGLTSREVAARVGIQPRSARRMLNRLERAGVARNVGTQPAGGRGRPLVVYRLDL